MVGELNTQQTKQILAVILSRSIEQIDAALNVKSTLLRHCVNPIRINYPF